jgi:uncharacterized protein YbaP (TraB family)
MALKHPVYQFLFAFAVTCGCAPVETDAASACVWKVTGPSGGTLYLGGSVHALRSSDYPLPPAYNRAFDASARLAFEQDPRDAQASAKLFSKTAQYPKGDSLKNHVDPRTYDYVRRVFKLVGVPEEKFSRFRPWALVIWLWSPNLHGLSNELGVEDFLQRRARANSKPIFGLESFREHLEVLSGLSERQSEALLLFTFIPDEQGGKGRFPRTVEAWRRGDADTLARMMQESFREFPAMGERMLGGRNRAWIPKIEGYLRSGQTYFVVAGAGHMGGPEGLLALLRARGCRIEQF